MSPDNNRARRRDQARNPQTQAPRTPIARFVKAPDSRILHVDGVYGGLTARGLVYMALFVEHNEVPAEQHFVVDAATRTIRVKEQNANPAWIREIQMEAMFTMDVAVSLRDWLTEKIELRERLAAEDSSSYRVIESAPQPSEKQGE